ncbi:MAG: DUF302 domain-containing protein [Paracoccaceae bacterium]
MRTLILAAALALPTAAAADDLIEKTSPNSVQDTADALVAAIEEAGATLFARVDHAEGAAGIGSELPQATRIIFGNPMVGTPILQEDIRAGLMVPPSVLIYDDEGETKIIYQEADDMFDDLDVDDDDEIVRRLEGALDSLTDRAIAD